MSKRSSRKNSQEPPRKSGGLGPAALTLLIAFGTIGGLNGVAAIISAVSSVIEVTSTPCTRDGGGGR